MLAMNFCCEKSKKSNLSRFSLRAKVEVIPCQKNLTKSRKFLENRDTYLIPLQMAGDANRLSENSDLDAVHAEIAEAPDESTLKKWVRNGVNTVAAVGLIATGAIAYAQKAHAEEVKKPVEVAAADPVELELDLDLDLDGLLKDITAEADAAKADADKAIELATKNAEAAKKLADGLEEAVSN